MSKKQIQCPQCQIVYRVDVIQLTIAQGWVCCANCNHEFNGLSHLLAEENSEQEATDLHSFTIEQLQPSPINQRNKAQDDQSSEGTVSHYSADYKLLELFDSKVQGSNVTLQHYLNGIHTFNHEPPPNNRTIAVEIPPKPLHFNQRHQLRYYVLWGLLNFALVAMLITQLVWFNYRDLLHHPVIDRASETVCYLVSCTARSDQYRKLELEDIQLEVVSKQKVQFHASLINKHSNSLYLPRLELTLYKSGSADKTYILLPEQYLKNELRGIQRIPNNRPFLVNFSIDKSKNDFDSYRLQIFRP